MARGPLLALPLALLLWAAIAGACVVAKRASRGELPVLHLRGVP